MNSNNSPTKTSRTNCLRRTKPGIDRGTPEGMEVNQQAPSKTNKTKNTANTQSSNSLKSDSVKSDTSDKAIHNNGCHAKAENSVDFSTADKLYNQLQSASKEIKDDLSLIYLDLDHTSPNTHNEVLIKRAWSLKDLFKRSSSNGKAAITSPSYVNQ